MTPGLRPPAPLPRMLLVVLLLCLVAPTAQAGPYHRVRRATSARDSDTLVALLHHRRAYVRELAARGLRGVAPRPDGLALLARCLENADEREWVRSTCGGTLGRWGAVDAIPAMAQALEEVGPEARYWLAEGLHQLDHPDAQNTLRGLQSDDDLLLATAAREWAP